MNASRLWAFRAASCLLVAALAGCAVHDSPLDADARRFPPQFRLDYRSAGPLSLDGRSLVLPVNQRAHGRANQVIVLTAGSPKPRVVANTQFDTGFINWAEATRGWVIWVDQSKVQADWAPNVLWRIWARPLHGGKPRLLSTNDSKPDPYVPWITASDGYVAWATAEPNRRARQWVWKVGDEQPRILLRNAELSPDIESITDGKLVYLGPSSLPHHGHTIGGDCWALDLGGGTPVALTHTGLASDCRASDGTLVWFRYIDAKHDKVPPDELYDDPWEVWTKPLDDTTSSGTRLHHGYFSGALPVIGRDLIAWSAPTDTSSWTVLKDGKPVDVRIPETALDVTASGDTLVYSDQDVDLRGPVTLRFLVP